MQRPALQNLPHAFTTQVFVGDLNGMFHAVDSTRQVRWTFKAEGEIKSPRVYGNRIYYRMIRTCIVLPPIAVHWLEIRHRGPQHCTPAIDKKTCLYLDAITFRAIDAVSGK
jgi:hypothetical protein